MIADNTTTNAAGFELSIDSGIGVDSFRSTGYNILGSTEGTALGADATNLADQVNVNLAAISIAAGSSIPTHTPEFGSPAIDFVITPPTSGFRSTPTRTAILVRWIRT